MPIFAFLYGRIIRKLIDAKNGSDMHAPVYYMLYLGLGLSVVSAGRVFCWTLSASRQVTRIQWHFFRACLRQQIGWHDLHSPGELTSRISGDTRIIHNGINEKLAQGITNLSTGVFGLILGLILSWELTLVMASVLPVFFIITIFVGKRIKEMAEATRRNYAVAGSIATEVMSNIKIVQAFGKEESEMKRFHEAALNAQIFGIKMSFLSSITPGVFMSICLVLYCVGLIFSSYFMQWERAGVDDIISTFIMLLASIFSFSSITNSMMAFIEARAAAHEIFQVIKSSPEIDIDAEGEPVDSFNESIELRDVTFSHPARPDMVLFRDLNLTIRKGQKVAFSGVSGCGKSSIIGLIQHFYDPNDGQLLCDGVDMRRLSLKDWRNQIGVVSQESSLFAGSMTYNVRLGKPTATFEEVVEACKKANIHDTIMSLPAQYDTSVGAVGSQLSGGQKQRIAIARALIKKPSILLLDEATSALDLKCEIEVQEALDSLIKDSGMTVIIVSHHLSTIRDVDCIYYIRHHDAEGSIIAESGTSDELIAQNSEFAAMARVQGAFSKSQVGTTGGARGVVEVGYSNIVLDDKALSKLEKEAPLTERQRVPIEKLASWEANHTKVGSGRIMSYCKDYTWAVALGVLGSAISVSVFPVNTVVYGYILDVLGSYTYDKDAHKLRKNANLYAPLFLIFSVASFLGVFFQTFYGYVGQKLTTRIRTPLFSRILHQDMSFFDIPGRDAGSLSAMLSGDCEAVHQLWGPSISFKIQTLSGLIAGMFIGFVFEWRLALVMLTCMPLIASSIYFQDTLYLRFINKDNDNNESIVTESLSNIRTVASFNLKDELTAAFHELQANKSSKVMKRSIIIAICYGIARFIFYGVMALCYWYGGELIKQGKTEFRNVVICISSLMMVSMEVGDAGGFATKVADAHKAAKHIFSVIDRTPDIDYSIKGDVDIGAGCQIDFGKVLFIYPARPKQVVLDSIDLQFNNTTFSGLIGEIGCGKSTIIQILARFYDKRSGRITVNGKNLEDIDITEWRKNMSIILQEPNLFSGTVRENIRYSKDDATDEEIEAALKLTDIHEDVLN
ncbi:unnamed protein product [Phytomonas sp. EM1]|nr:unnamed protein product [Phytomonas sp. EM1]|eukprot:CCW60554.1 unnamed protein product [Phytomonas sp. isolate EM1]